MAVLPPLLALLVIAAAGPVQSVPRDPDALARGLELLASDEPDSALAPILEAHAAGMPKDSLYYFLAEIARRKTALDTAMAFNLAIGTPVAGAFRDSVLAQRYRLFMASNLIGDARALRDSLAGPVETPQGRPQRKLTARMGSGYFRESNHDAIDYPFGPGLGGYAPRGWQHRARGQFEFPVVSGSRWDWTGGLEIQAMKSYAKDSVDYRLGGALRAENPTREGWSAGIGAEAGRITGSGWVSGCKAEAGWLSLRSGKLALITGGVASEWDGQGRQRYQSAWLTGIGDWTSGGRGFSGFLSISGLRLAPITASKTHYEIYVDDVSKAQPVHFQDGSYADTIPASGRTTFARYVSAVGRMRTSSRSPMSSFSATPSLGYALPIGGGVIADFNVSATASWYPEPYRWDQAPLAEGAVANDDSLHFARNQADGKAYAVDLILVDGGFRETYGAAPLARRERVRLDGQGEAEFGLRRAFGGWGNLAATVMARKNVSTVAGEAPVWIPDWYAGAAIRWSGDWGW